MERVPEPAPGATSGTVPIEDADDSSFVPMYRLPPAERTRNRAQMDRILDILEEEERIESERHRARDREQRREELEKLRANAKTDPGRTGAAKEMQKKMGKALLKNMADAREKEEKEKARQEREDLEREEARKARKPRKCVSWAELPKQERLSACSPDHDGLVPDLSGKLPMRTRVVERFPARSGASSPPPPVPAADSDDESDPPSPVPSDSDTSGEFRSAGVPFSTPERAESDDGSEDEDEPVESHGSEDEFDIDTMQHQREIALAYFEKRNTIGADAARALSAHSPDVGGGREDEWDQEASRLRSSPASVFLELTEAPEQDVPLDATLSGPRPKPSQSKFKSERLAQAYFDDTRLPSSTPATSLAPSVVLPNSTTGALRSAVRLGWLDGGQLVGNGDSDGGEDEGDIDADLGTRELVEAFYRRDVTNVGAVENSDALIAALETAYGAPPKQPQNSHPSPLSPPTVVTTSIPVSATPSKTTPPVVQKSSKFKLARAVPPPTIANDEGLREGGADMVEHGTALSTKSPSPAPMHVVGSPPVPDSSASQLPTIIDSPSFAPPPGSGGGDAPSPMTNTIIDSPSFQKPQVPIPSARQMRRPPTVQPWVRESSGAQKQQETSTQEPRQKVSRFKAQRAEP